jgi:ubiquinone/menaquinone biosynthesis C-methylase UbiE
MSQASPLASPLPWNLVAPAYAEEVVPWFETFSHAALELAAPPPGSPVVDVACGPGTLSVLAARKGHPVDALDFSPGMIEKLEARIGSLPIKVCVGDGQALPYADGTFSAGFSLFGLMFFPDRAKGFAELRRVLKPGACAVVSSWPPSKEAPILDAVFAAIREVTGQPADTQRATLSGEDLYRDEMGPMFTRLEIHRVVGKQTAPSADALWESFTRSLAPLVLLRQRAGERWPQIATACRAAIGRVVGDGPVELVMPAIVAVGTV